LTTSSVEQEKRRLPANSVLWRPIDYLPNRPVGRPPYEVRRYYASFLLWVVPDPRCEKVDPPRSTRFRGGYW